MPTPRTLLIANRGEIAVRIARTASQLGWRVIAVVADGDPSPHARHCDETVRIPSYLDIEAIVAAAQATGAGFVHPGYGFLSERAKFARAVAVAGLTLVGPSAVVMEQLGDKAAARRIAEAAGVPVVPSYDAAANLGYPVLVKAAAGGGGKGMRIVRAPGELADAMAAAAREAQAAFGDDRLLIEQFVEHGRHIEVQVFGDSHGHVISLGERDCSAQRRHQKVIEESPAPRLADSTRAQIQAAARALAERVGYQGAGTVEFLLDVERDAFYFLEMNTRLQVEHPVTELVTGLDLVEWQLRVALGEALPMSQDEVRTVGHAIEARIYAEDPYAGFLPQAGLARYVEWPTQTPSLRVDQALESGQEVSARFDPMLAKVIAHGADREEARLRLIDALDRTVIAGLATNTGFVRELLASPAFAAARIETGTLDAAEPDPEPGLVRARRIAARAASAGTRRTGPWAGDGWRLGGPAEPARVLLDRLTLVEPEPDPQDGDEPTGRVWITAAGIEVVCEGQRTLFARRDPFAHEGEVVGDGQVLAPMPGTLLRLEVADGDRVEAGQALGVLEAMKMEFTLRAPHAGVVTGVAVSAGDQVGLGTRLLGVEAEP